MGEVNVWNYERIIPTSNLSIVVIVLCKSEFLKGFKALIGLN